MAEAAVAAVAVAVAVVAVAVLRGIATKDVNQKAANPTGAGQEAVQVVVARLAELRRHAQAATAVLLGEVPGEGITAINAMGAMGAIREVGRGRGGQI